MEDLDGGSDIADMTNVWTPSEQSSAGEEYLSWLGSIQWRLFCTFTFAWSVSDAQALKVFREFVNRLERYLRGPIAYVRGDEKRFSGCGKPGAPRHFHLLLAAHRRIDPVYVSDLWMSMAGRRENGAGADVRIYHPELPGLAYILKYINEPDGDWNFRNLDLFLPGRELSTLRSRQRRRLARHQQRSDFAKALATDDFIES